MDIGKTNRLKAARTTEFGFFLIDDEGNEVLLPNAYVSDELKLDDEIDVFIYRDSENRIVATTLKPYVELDEFAYLKVNQVNKYGAFLDWGLLKDLMVPFSEQNERMEEGRSYVIFMFIDESSERLVATTNLNEFFYNDDIDVKEGDEVELLLYKMTDLGMNAIVDNLYKGLIFNSDIHKNIQVGDRIKGYVKQVRKDGKIDVALEPMGYKDSIEKTADIILSAIKDNDGLLELTDKSSPEDISQTLGLSKKAFKRGLGYLYKKKLVKLLDGQVKLV
jgi:hypothetical protein